MSLSLSHTELSYLGSVYALSQGKPVAVSTSAIAKRVGTSSAAVSEMLQKLARKGLLTYTRYQGAFLTPQGVEQVYTVLRRQGLWEFFLVHHLQVDLEELGSLASLLASVSSGFLIDKLSSYVGHPSYAPVSGPIPDALGKMRTQEHALADLDVGQSARIVAINDDHALFLRYLSHRNVCIGAHVEVLERLDFDGSVDVRMDKQRVINLSKQAAERILTHTL